MKVKEVIKILENDGWHIDRTRGSHRIFKHQSKSGIVVIPEPATEVGKVAVMV